MLLMLGAYALLLSAKVPVQWIIVVFGAFAFVSLMIWLAKRRNSANERQVNLRGLIEE